MIVIRPWTIGAVAASGGTVRVPALPFPYMLRSALLQVAAGGGVSDGYIDCVVQDGEQGELFRSSSEVFATGLGASITFAPGLHRGSGGRYFDTAAPGPVDYPPIAVQGVLGVASAQGGLPPDFWIMPQMRLQFSGLSLNPPAAAIAALRLVIGFVPMVFAPGPGTGSAIPGLYSGE